MPIDPIQFRWFDEHRIEMPVMSRARRRWFRFSGHLYNDAEDFTRVVGVFLPLPNLPPVAERERR